MRHVFCAEFGLHNQLFEGVVELLHGVGDWAIRGFRATVEQFRQAGADNTGIELGEEQAHALAQGGDRLAVGARNPLQQSMES